MSEQGRYQIRFDWMPAGARALDATGDVDVFVWVDAVERQTAPDAALPPSSSLPSPADELPLGGAIVRGSIDSAAAVAQWVLMLQQHLARRVMVAIIAAGDTRPDGSFRVTVEDLLAAGAIVDRLCALGLDATSPEAAVAEAAYRGLRPALAHLVSASVSGDGGAASFPSRIVDDWGPEDVVVLRHHPLA